MIRMAIFAGAAGCLLVSSMAAGALTLRDTVVAHGDTVNAGDFFADAGNVADVPLFEAPAPGRKGDVSAGRLREAARAVGLDWSPADPHMRIAVSRPPKEPRARIAGFEIVQAVRTAILDALVEAKEAADLTLSWPRDPDSVVLPSSEPHAFSVVKLDLDRQARRFGALIEIRQGDHREERRVQGRYSIWLPVPVLAAPIGRGDIVTADHIAFERMLPPANGVLTDASEIIGMAARRPLRAGQTIRSNDIEPKRIVSRNQLVTIVFEMPGLLLTTQGRSLGDAAEGQEVSVVNVRSNRIVQAVAQGPGRVIVASGIERLAMR